MVNAENKRREQFESEKDEKQKQNRAGAFQGKLEAVGRPRQKSEKNFWAVQRRKRHQVEDSKDDIRQNNHAEKLEHRGKPIRATGCRLRQMIKNAKDNRE